jgi:hypothetical protein
MPPACLGMMRKLWPVHVHSHLYWPHPNSQPTSTVANMKLEQLFEETYIY